MIAGIADAMPPGSRLFGFLGGPSGIVGQKYTELTLEKIAPYRNQGGFDLIGSGRTKIETPEQFEGALKSATALNLDGLVIIGGDDSNTNAALLAEYFLEHKCKTRVVGVPKTIDGDLRSDDVEISFGFDTAAKTYSEVIGNILRDCLSAKKYFFFIKLMGRSASHLTLECALQTHPNMALISEEIAEKGYTFNQVVKQIADLIDERTALGKNYGVVLIPEGLIEFIPDFAEVTKELDPHGNLKVSQIETERLLIDAVRKVVKNPAKFAPLPEFCGYEGRSALPSNFDCQYCYALGHVATLLVQEKRTGYMACVKNLTAPVEQWQIAGIPLTSMINLEVRKGEEKPVIKKALVELEGKPFREFAAAREAWRLNDAYRYPGPIQFFGPPELTDSVPLSLNK